MTKQMSAADWYYVKNMARQEGVTLKKAGVIRSMMLGQAMDRILAAAGK